MMYNCGCGNQSISISSILFSTLSISDLEALCNDFDYTSYSSSPWYDSVLENGEYDAKKEKALEETETEDDRDEDIFGQENYYEE